MMLPLFSLIFSLHLLCGAAAHEQKQRIFDLYNPLCSRCHPFEVRGTHNPATHELSLQLFMHQRPVNNIIILHGNDIYMQDKEKKHPQQQLIFYDSYNKPHPIKLSLVARQQMPKTVFNGKYLIVGQKIFNTRHPEALTSFAGIKSLLKQEKISKPVIIIDLHAWLTQTFGKVWSQLLPIYLHKHRFGTSICTQAEHTIHKNDTTEKTIKFLN